MNNKKSLQNFSFQVGEKEIKGKINYLALQANGSALVQSGDTVVLITASMGGVREGIDFFPLSVEYEENYWAAGKIKGSRFMKRKGRPTDEAVINGRLIDRSIRPLFPKGMRNEVQIVINILSYDFENDPRPLAIIGTSLALETSNIPFLGPLTGVLIGKNEQGYLINPTRKEQREGSLNIFVAGFSENITMVESDAKEVAESEIIEALAIAQKENKKMGGLVTSITESIKKEKLEPYVIEADPEIQKKVEKEALPSLEKIFASYEDKKSYELQIKELKESILNKIAPPDDSEMQIKVGEAFDEINKKLIRSNVLEKNKRLGGRSFEEVRPLSLEVSILPRVHGSALFNRGETQGLTTATLGSPGDDLILDGMENETDEHKRYFHYYGFPPFSNGECYPMRGPGRREVGHGFLGEKALLPVIPSKETFPYTISMHTEIMGSDGSTSMASVCGSTLALMDAGVPIKSPVAGVAMGLIIDEKTKKYQVLTDLCANEDFAGHMDFKVAGTAKGITALQMDIKAKGLDLNVLTDALEAAKKGRNFILTKMLEVIPEPRKDLSSFAPRIEIVKINPEKIGSLVGPGGKMINSIIETTGVQIDIEDDGSVFITGPNKQSMEEALKMVKTVTKEPKIGEIYEAKITRVMDFGAFAEFLPKKEGLIHISKFNKGDRTTRMVDIVKIGDTIKIRIEEIDNLGRYNLSLKE